MSQQDMSPTETAILSVLTGTPVKEAAVTARISPARLTRAAARYRAGGQSALDLHGDGWHQFNVQFTNYPSARRDFTTYLLPELSTPEIEAWWFVRKHPSWRVRIRPSTRTPVDETLAHVTKALDTAVERGAARDWQAVAYEPETAAFGGPAGIALVHDLFHADSKGVLEYLHHADSNHPRAGGTLDSKVTSFLITTLLLRSAQLEWGEQGDVWARIEEHRPLPPDVDPHRIDGMIPVLRHLLMADLDDALAHGPLRPLQGWATAMRSSGRALAVVAGIGSLRPGLRSVLSRIVLFHWNRMGFTTRQQSIWSRAARQAVLG